MSQSEQTPSVQPAPPAKDLSKPLTGKDWAELSAYFADKTDDLKTNHRGTSPGRPPGSLSGGVKGLPVGKVGPDMSAQDYYQNLQHLNARHREVVRLASLGHSNVMIARILGMSQVTVGLVLRSTLAQEMLSEIQEARTDSVKDVHNRLQEMSPLAAETTLDIMVNGKKDADRLKAAQSVLEMTGQKAPDKHISLNASLTLEEIKAIKREYVGGPEIIEEAQVIEQPDGDSDGNSKDTKQTAAKASAGRPIQLEKTASESEANAKAGEEAQR